MELNRDFIENAIEVSNIDRDDANVDPSYSGRDMYGKTCLGITLPGTRDALRFMANLGADMGIQNQELELQDLIEGASIDSMGTDVVLYFPGVSLDDAAA